MNRKSKIWHRMMLGRKGGTLPRMDGKQGPSIYTWPVLTAAIVKKGR